MDPRLLRAYNEELVYLREGAREFGTEFESVAGRLGLGAATEADPHVERLLEGVAFLGARVQLKLQDQFPDFTQHLLNAVQPQYIAPTPSMCVVGFEPRSNDGAIAAGVSIPRHTKLQAVANDRDKSPVTFRTGHDVTLLPLEILEAEYLPTRTSVASFIPKDVDQTIEAGLRIRLGTTGGVRLGDLSPRSLPIYLDGAETGPGELYRQLIGDAAVAIGKASDSSAGSSSQVRLPLPSQHGFDEDHALLPCDRRSHRGYRLLAEYFACPERFLFFSIDGLDEVFASFKDEASCDIIILFRRTVDALNGSVSSSNFRLFATPAINLFEKQVDRVAISAFDHELQVIADRTRPLDFEIYRLLDVKAHSRENADAMTVAPLYDFAGHLYDWSDALFYVTRLRSRRLSTREQRARRRSDYVGTETWLSMSAPGRANRLEEIRELSIRALVTNRELSEMVRTGTASPFVAEGLPVRGISILRPPTPPKPPLGLNDGAWRVIAHLSPNFTSFAGDVEGDPAVLRGHLALYGRVEDAALRRQVDGIRSVRSKPVSRRAPGSGPSAFVRGQRLHIMLDETSYESARMFLFSAVLERFLGEFASINSFTETVFETAQQGTFASWPARIGLRPTI